jgi:alpha-mannosidase
MHWNDTNQLPFRLFWWESPDGSKVLTYFPTDYVHDNVNPTRISADFAESADRNPGTSEMLDLYGIGDHGGGPTRAMLDQADHWIAAGKQDAVPTMRYHTAQNYFTNVEKNLNPASPTWNYDSIAKGYTAPPASSTGAIGLPTWKDELYFEYHRGVFTTQAAHKRNMRTSETATLDAEKLASFAWLDGQPYPAAELTENWKKITFNQFHDLAAGSGIAVIYKDAQRDYTEVFHADKLIDENSIKTISSLVDTTNFLPQLKSVPLIATNTLAWPRDEVIELQVQLPESSEHIVLYDRANAHPYVSQVIAHDKSTNTFTVLAQILDMPSMGYKVFHAAGVSEPINSGGVNTTNQEPFVLDNGSIRATVDGRTGCIVSLVSLDAKLKPQIEYLARNSCGNQLQTYVDTPKQYDAWNIDPGTLDGKMTPIANVDSIAVTDNGPLRKTIRITRTWQSSKFIQDISLDAHADFIRISNDIDWHETHTLLKAAFPLAATGPKATYEIPFGSIERPTTRNDSWEKAKFEVPAMRWADLGDDKQGLSILNDSKYGYDAAGNTLRITLLRSPTWPDPEADRGHQHFVYALYPHTGTWKQAQTVHRGYELNDPLKAEQVFPHTGTLPAEHSWASIENPNVTLTAIKKAEDTDALVFRMYEWAGTPTDVKLHIPPGATYAIETNLMEKPEGVHLTLSGDVVTVPIKPYEILTIEAVYPTKTVAAK